MIQFQFQNFVIYTSKREENYFRSTIIFHFSNKLSKVNEIKEKFKVHFKLQLSILNLHVASFSKEKQYFSN